MTREIVSKTLSGWLHYEEQTDEWTGVLLQQINASSMWERLVRIPNSLATLIGGTQVFFDFGVIETHTKAVFFCNDY